MSNQLTKAYLVRGLKQIYQNRKKKYNIICSSIENDTIRSDFLNVFFDYCKCVQNDIQQVTSETVYNFIKFYLGTIDTTSPTNPASSIYISFAKSCAEYCNKKINNFSNDVFERWFTESITYDDFIVPCLREIKTKIEKLILMHEINTREYYIISPLIFSSCRKSIKLNDDCCIIYPGVYFSIIKNKSNISNIIKRFSKFFGVIDSDFTNALRETFTNYKHLYHENFYYHPLLIIRIRDTFDNAIHFSKVITARIKHCLELSLHSSNSEINTKQLTCENIRTPLRFFISGIGVSPYTVVEKKPQTEFKYDLSPLSNKQTKKQFNRLWKIIWDNNQLMNLYRKTLRIYFWNCDDGAKTLEHNNITTIMRIIAMETFLLFTTNGAKKEPLANIISGLYKGKDIEKRDIEKIVINIYKSRSNFVHGGIPIPDSFFEKPSDDLSITILQKDLEIVKKCFVDILCKFPIWYNKQTSKRKAYANWKNYCMSLISSLPQREQEARQIKEAFMKSDKSFEEVIKFIEGELETT